MGKTKSPGYIEYIVGGNYIFFDAYIHYELN